MGEHRVLEYEDLYLSKQLSRLPTFGGWRGGDGCSVSFAHHFGSWAKILLCEKGSSLYGQTSKGVLYLPYLPLLHLWPSFHHLTLIRRSTYSHPGGRWDNKNPHRTRCGQDHQRGGGRHVLFFPSLVEINYAITQQCFQDFSVNSQTYKVRRKTASPVKSENSTKMR